VSEMTGSSGRRSMTDREIAEDLLAGQKYLSNYYYAPAILEAGDPGLRSAFQEVHAGATTAAKSVFDYLHSKGWYQVRKADDQAISDLRNAVTESRQVVDINVNRGGNNVSMNQGPGGWTGTQYGEGQSGMGPSSVSQGARWGGESSWMHGGGGQFQPSHQQGNIPAWARGGFGGQGGFGAQQAPGGGWTGTQYGEGQSGYGPSSLGQGARWGGEPSWSTGFGGQYQSMQGLNLPSWARGGFAQQSGPGNAGWTGTQAGEGQSGFGPSSLGQYGTGSWQGGSSMGRQPWQQTGQGNWQSQ
jgi:hypothetical protein